MRARRRIRHVAGCAISLDPRASILRSRPLPARSPRPSSSTSLFLPDQFQCSIESWGDLPDALGIVLCSLLRGRLRVPMTFAGASVNSGPGFPALRDELDAEVPSFRFAEQRANRARAASAFRRTAQRSIDVADAPGAVQRRDGRPDCDVRQHVTRTNDHPWLPGDGRPHRGFLYNPNLNKGLRWKGFGPYLVERDPLRQWGPAQFRINLRMGGQAQLRLCLNRVRPPEHPGRPPTARPEAVSRGRRPGGLGASLEAEAKRPTEEAEGTRTATIHARFEFTG